MVKIVWTEFAKADWKLIHEYISQDSRTYASKFIEGLIERVDQLENFPHWGRIVPEFGNNAIRELIEGGYRIANKINSDYIGTVRVHHSARKWK